MWGFKKMWSRSEVKKYAKDFLKQHYWKTFIVVLIGTVLANGYDLFSSSNGVFDLRINIQYILGQQIEAPIKGNEYFQIFGSIMNQFKPYAFFGLGIITLSSVVISIVVILTGNILNVGIKKFFIDGFENDVNINKLFFGFNINDYLPIIKVQLLSTLYIILWSLLFIIPGIVKAYQYRFVPYILAEDTSLGVYDVLKKSKAITNGQKAEMLILDLSFFPYYLLNLFTFGLSSYFVEPYIQASYTHLYKILSKEFDELSSN